MSMNETQWSAFTQVPAVSCYQYESLARAKNFTLTGLTNLIYELANGGEVLSIDEDWDALRVAYEGAPNPGPAVDEWRQCQLLAMKILGDGDTRAHDVSALHLYDYEDLDSGIKRTEGCTPDVAVHFLRAIEGILGGP